MNGKTEQVEVALWQEFYNKLGYLYFGVAAAAVPMDGDNIAMLKKAVNRIWTENGPNLYLFQAYTTNKVDALFDWLGLNETEWQFCIDEFLFFIKQHKQEIPPTMHDFSLKTAKEITQYLGESKNQAVTKLESAFQS